MVGFGTTVICNDIGLVSPGLELLEGSASSSNAVYCLSMAVFRFSVIEI